MALGAHRISKPPAPPPQWCTKATFTYQWLRKLVYPAAHPKPTWPEVPALHKAKLLLVSPRPSGQPPSGLRLTGPLRNCFHISPALSHHPLRASEEWVLQRQTGSQRFTSKPAGPSFGSSTKAGSSSPTIWPCPAPGGLAWWMTTSSGWLPQTGYDCSIAPPPHLRGGASPSHSDSERFTIPLMTGLPVHSTTRLHVTLMLASCTILQEIKQEINVFWKHVLIYTGSLCPFQQIFKK